MDKKGIDLLWTTIAVAIIVIIVIVVSVFIFGDKSGKFNKNIDSCLLKGGQCTTKTSCDPGAQELPDASCPDKESDGIKESQICCLSITSIT